MDNIIIYGILNEDRRIFWVGDLWFDDAYGDVYVLEDAIWKNLMVDNQDILKLLEDADEEKDIVILDTVKRDEWDVKRLMKWINIFELKNYVICSLEELIDFKMKQEREWDEEDKKNI